MGRKLTRKGLKKRLDVLWSKAVKKRDKYTCQRCMKKCSENNCDSHHIWGKGSDALRYSLLNGITLCKTHHRFDETAAHGIASYLFDWKEFYIDFMGEETYWRVKKLGNVLKAYSTIESLKDLEKLLSERNKV